MKVNEGQPQNLMQLLALFNQQQFRLSQNHDVTPITLVAPPLTIVPPSTIMQSPSIPSPSSNASILQDYEVLIHIQAKLKPGSCKNAKPEIKVFEPCQLSMNLDWEGFLALKVSSMQYRWSKPKSSTDVPLISEDGYSSMMKNLSQLGKKANEGGFRVMVTMDPPQVMDPVCSFNLF